MIYLPKKPALIRPHVPALVLPGAEGLVPGSRRWLMSRRGMMAASGVGGVAAVTHVDSDQDPVNRSEYTFTVNFGADVAGRKIGVILTGAGASAATISGVTIGGEVANQEVAATDNETHASAWEADPSGTSDDVVVTWTGTKANCGIDVFRIVDAAASSTATASGTANPCTGTLSSIPKNGIIIAGAIVRTDVGQGGASRTFSWTNATEAAGSDRAIEASICYGAAGLEAYASEQTSIAITATPSGATDEEAFVAVSWGPK